MATATKTYRQMTKLEKLSHLKSLTDNAAKRVQRSRADWREFLRFYANFYKYSFHEALLIYEQAPYATACGELKHWNAVGRRVNRGTSGIPIISDSDKNMDIRYVFDIADTYGANIDLPRKWTLPPKYMNAVATEIQKRLQVSPPTEYDSKNLKWAVEEYVRERCLEYADTLRYSVEDSYLEELDDDNLRMMFRYTIVDSVGYLVSERLGLKQGLYDDDEFSFEHLYNFNTKAALYLAGAATGEISRSVLTMIAEVIRKEQNNERTKNNDERREIHNRTINYGAVDDSGGNRGSGADRTGSTAPDEQVRQSVLGLPERESSGQTRIPVSGNNAVGHMPASRQGSAGDDGDDTKSAPHEEPAAEGRLYGTGSVQHEAPRPSGGIRSERDSVQTEITEESEDTTAAGEKPPLSASTERSIRDIFNAYAPRIVSQVLYNETYLNARANSDEQNSKDECRAAVHKVVMDWGLDEPDLYRAYLNTSEFKKRMYDYVFKKTYLDVQAAVERAINPPAKKPPQTVRHRNYNAFAALAPEIISGEATYIRYSAGESFIPLSIDLIGKNRFSIAHNFEQNGDLMADPDMEFVFDNEAGTLSARTYQQDGLGMYQSVEGGKGEVVNQTLAKQLDSFARQWFANIKAQDYQKERMTVEHRGEEIEVVYGVDGSISAINGESEAVYAYSLKIGYTPPVATSPRFEVYELPDRKGYYAVWENKQGGGVFYEDENGTVPAFTDKADAELYRDKLQETLTTPLGSDNEPDDVFVLPEAPERPKTERAQFSLFDIEPIPQPEPVSEQTIEPVIADIDNAGTDYFNGNDADTDEFDDDDTSPIAVADDAPPAPVPATMPKPPNFRITAEVDVGGGGAKTKYRRNAEAISLLKTIEAEERYATPDEQRILALYSGWGGISQVFKDGHNDWRNEYSELKSLLSEKEYRDAAASTLNAHYTTPEIIEGIYAGLERLGFRGGNIIEPAMGVGNFYGCMPESMAEASRLYGVELDSITGRIAKQLYPNADIRVQGFESTNFQDNIFDAAIGNVPFGQYKLNDPKLDKYGFLIHDYFFAKALDKVRPGGVVAFITSKGTMDKANTSVRRYLAERAELLGAIRLPNTAFKSNAGTEVTSDIIFLKKRDRIVSAEDADWIHTGETEDGIPLNEYFVENPHMMLGTMAIDDRMYGNGSETTLNPDGRDLQTALFEAIEFLSEGAISEAEYITDFDDDSASDIIPADPTVKNYCYVIADDGEIYQRVDSRMEPREFAKAAAERVTAMIEMRTLVRTMLTRQVDGCSDRELEQLQTELNSKYDKFFRKYKAINSRYNISLFGDDADFPLLSSVEEVDDDGNTVKASIFTKRTIESNRRITHVESPLAALPVCLNERGYIDIAYMASLAGTDHDSTINALRGIIFKNPAYDDPDEEDNIYIGWETADEYLSGRVKDKLAAAELAVRDNPIYEVNVEALRAVQPKPLEAHEISVRIGAHWIDSEYYRQFLLEKINPPDFDIKNVQVHYTPQLGEWTVEKPRSRFTSVTANKTYGTDRMDAYTLFEVTLNQKNARIFDTIYVDGKERRVLNHEKTVAIRDRQTMIKQEFKRWIFDDYERRDKLCAKYNELFNSVYLSSKKPAMYTKVKTSHTKRIGCEKMLQNKA